jgi:hypothetical protein
VVILGRGDSASSERYSPQFWEPTSPFIVALSKYVYKDGFGADSKNVRLYPLSVKASWLVADGTALERALAPEYKRWLEEGF